MTRITARKGTLPRGQGLTEFALVLPVLLMIIMGIFDFGRVLLVYSMASKALRDSARKAVVLGYATDAIPPYTNCDLILNTAKRVFFAQPIVTVRYEKFRDSSIEMCSSGEIIDADWLENGDMLQITSTATVRFLTPIMSAIIPSLTFRFTAQRTIVKTIAIGMGDAQADKDYDGMADMWEDEHFGDDDGNIENTDLLEVGTADWDNDGCTNGCEEARGSNPKVADTDGDHLNDGEEVYTYGTDPTLADTDGDGIPDDQELIAD